MPEKYTPEEALQEALLIQELAKKQAAKEGLAEPEARHFEFISEKVDEKKRENPALYEAALQVAEKKREVEAVDPELRQLFLDLVAKASKSAMIKLRDRVMELKTFTQEFANTISADRLSELRAEKKNEIVAACVRDTQQTLEELLHDELIREAFQGKEDVLQKLREYHFGENTVVLQKQSLLRSIDQIEPSLR